MTTPNKVIWATTLVTRVSKADRKLVRSRSGDMGNQGQPAVPAAAACKDSKASRKYIRSRKSAGQGRKVFQRGSSSLSEDDKG